MRIAIIGAGNIGANTARHFVNAGHQVSIATSGDVAKPGLAIRSSGVRSQHADGLGHKISEPCLRWVVVGPGVPYQRDLKVRRGQGQGRHRRFVGCSKVGLEFIQPGVEAPLPGSRMRSLQGRQPRQVPS